MIDGALQHEKIATGLCQCWFVGIAVYGLIVIDV